MKFVCALLLPGIMAAGVLPETIGPYYRIALSTPTLSNQSLWREYGLKSSEIATYENGKERFTAEAYRLQDSTAALGTFDWQRPPDAKASKLANLSAETAKLLLIADGNYLLSFEGYKPSKDELARVLESLRDVDSTPLPNLTEYFPSQGLVPNSERYVIGPAGLAAFDPAIPPSTAAFHLGAEAQIGDFRSPKGNMKLALFDYPTPQIAMQREAEFQKISGAMVKRSGPMLAVIVAPPDPDVAERLLAQVRYEAQVTLHEPTPATVQQVGRLIINIFILIGILLAFCLIAGLFVGGFRVLLLRGRKGQAEDPMIMLHLER